MFYEEASSVLKAGEWIASCQLGEFEWEAKLAKRSAKIIHILTAFFFLALFLFK